MNGTFLVAAASAAFLTPGVVFAQQRLLYVPLNAETSTQCPALPMTTTVTGHEMEHIVPAAPPLLPAAFKTRQADEIMLGDSDLDGMHYEPGLYNRIDAIQPPLMIGGAAIQPNARNVWFSPAAATPALAGAPQLNEMELGRVLPNGFLEVFVTKAQIDAAFGLGGVQENLDGAVLVWGIGLFVSFETAVDINTTFHGAVAGVPDGTILAIPFNAIMWGASAYDAAAFVQNVVAGSGVIVLTEAQVDAKVAASGIRDNAGALVTLVGDLDGLEQDPLGGSFVSPQLVEHQFFQMGMVPNLIFCGLNLTGGGIVSTSGNIAVINGVPMGNAAAATIGDHVGLVTGGGVGSLNGLGLTAAGLVPFTTECTPQLLAAGTVSIELASEAGGWAWLAMHYPAVAGVGLVDPSVAVPFSVSFPDLYALAPVLFPGPVGGGCPPAFNLPIPAAAYGAIAGTRALFQGVHLMAGGGIALSTPSAVQLY